MQSLLKKFGRFVVRIYSDETSNVSWILVGMSAIAVFIGLVLLPIMTYVL